MNKKKLLSLALVLILIASLSFGTLAWFSDKDEVTNKFLVAGSDDEDPDAIFSVDVWEKVDTDGDGEWDSVNPGHRQDDGSAEYKNILPGDKLPKNVFVENTGAYDQYVRVIVTISDAQAWINAVGENFDAATLFDKFNPDMWDKNHIWNNVSEAGDNIAQLEEIVYVLYYKDVLKSGGHFTVFEAVNIPTTLTQEQAAKFDGGFTINVKAQALQTENVLPDNYVVGQEAYYAFTSLNIPLDQ